MLRCLKLQTHLILQLWLSLTFTEELWFLLSSRASLDSFSPCRLTWQTLVKVGGETFSVLKSGELQYCEEVKMRSGSPYMQTAVLPEELECCESPVSPQHYSQKRAVKNTGSVPPQRSSGLSEPTSLTAGPVEHKHKTALRKIAEYLLVWAASEPHHWPDRGGCAFR